MSARDESVAVASGASGAMLLDALTTLAARFPQFSLRRVTWADAREWPDKPTGLVNGWWAVATEEGGYYTFAATPSEAVAKVCDV